MTCDLPPKPSGTPRFWGRSKKPFIQTVRFAHGSFRITYCYTYLSLGLSRSKVQ
jgi:hypothetical protein